MSNRISTDPHNHLTFESQAMLLEAKMIVELSNSHDFPPLNGESGVVVSDVGIDWSRQHRNVSIVTGRSGCPQ